MSKSICCCFGHREVYKDIAETLDRIIEELITEKGVFEFWTGGMGDFDGKFASAVRAKKKQYPDVKLILIKPYFSNDLNTNREYYDYLYDDVVIPDAIAGAHYKSAITKRNRWMVDYCDVIVTFVYRDHGGAYDAKKYAIKSNKTVVEINDLIN